MQLAALFTLSALVAQATPAPSAGDLAFRHGDFDAAFAAYSSAVAANPNDAGAVLGLGTIELYRNHLPAARTYLMKATQLDPSNSRIAARLRALEGREPNARDFRIAMTTPEVDVPFVATDPLPLVRVKINGADALLFIDTGAPSIALTPAAAERLHVPTHAAGEGVFLGGKTAEVREGRIDSFAVPGLTVSGIPSNILPGELQLAGHQLDGAIGTAFLYRFLSTIDYVHGKLILRPHSSSAAFEAAAAKSGDTIVPMWLVADHFIFARGRVNDAPEALFNIDTGGTDLGVQLTKAALDAAHITPDASKGAEFTGGAGEARALPFTAASVSLGTAVRNDMPGLYFPDGDQYKLFPFEVAGTLSHVFFRPTALTFDFDAMKLIVPNE